MKTIMNSRFKRITSILLAIMLVFQLSSCGLLDSAKNTVGTVKNSATNIKDKIVEWYDNIDLNCFKKGWDAASSFVAGKYQAVVASDYIANLTSAINQFKSDINSSLGSTRGIAQEAGYAAEYWMSDTFNIDALAKGSNERAIVVGSTELGSVDVETTYGELASLKYYRTAPDSARAQAKTIIGAYREYKSKANNPVSLEEYMEKHFSDLLNQKALLSSIYDGQTRIIPSDQLHEAKLFLEGRISKLGSIDGQASSELTKTYIETLNNLRDRLQSPDGTQSTPITNAEMQAVAELAIDGEFTPEDFGFKLTQIIRPKYVLKNSLDAGFDSAIFKTALTVAPDVLSIIIDAIKTGELDTSMLKETGIDGLIAAGSGFLEGSISYSLVVAAQAGALGDALKSASPTVISAIVVITVEAIRYGYSLAKGDITPEEYGCLMAQMCLGYAVSAPIAAAVVLLTPNHVKLGIFIGGIIGSFIASGIVSGVKTIVLAVKDAGGFLAILPDGVIDTLDVYKAEIAKLNIKEAVSSLKDIVLSTLENGKISISRLVN